MRYRDLETGVFLTRDPIGYGDGPNVYCYVSCNPITRFDALGLSMKENAESWGTYGKVCYGILNVISLGVLDRNNTRQERYERGEISYKQMATGCVVDGGANIALTVAGGTALKGAGTAAKAVMSPQGVFRAMHASKVLGPAIRTAAPFTAALGAQTIGVPEVPVTTAPAAPTPSTSQAQVAAKSEAEAVSTVHGNSNASTTQQHGYVIRDTQNGGVVVKNGISGQPLNKNGTSPRANAQVNKWNKEKGNEGRYQAEVVFEVKAGEGARAAAKAGEKAVSDQNRATLDPERHTTP